MNNSNRGQTNRNYQGKQYRPTSGGRESNLRSDWYERDPMDERSGYRAENSRPTNPNYGYESPVRSSMNDDSGYDQSSRRASRGGRDEHQFDTFGSRSSSSSDFYRPSDAEDYESDYSRSGGSDYDRAYTQQSRGMRSQSSPQNSNYNNYDSQRYTQGQGAYGTSSSGQTGSYGSGGYYGSDRPSGSSYGQDFGRNYEGSSSLIQDRNRSWQSSEQGYGQSSNQGYGQNESRSQYSGRGPKSFKRSDERIKEEVCEMLTRHHAINADDIEVDVKEGEVTLTGTVSDRRMKHLAEDVAEQCYGVKDVTNNIRVKRSEETESSSDRKGGSSTSSTTGKKSATGSTSTNPLPNH